MHEWGFTNITMTHALSLHHNFMLTYLQTMGVGHSPLCIIYLITHDIHTYVATYMTYKWVFLWIICTYVSESDDDELSTGVAVAISIVVTFIITLVVTALISIIIPACITSIGMSSRRRLKWMMIILNIPMTVFLWTLIQLMELLLPSKWIPTQLMLLLFNAIHIHLSLYLYSYVAIAIIAFVIII